MSESNVPDHRLVYASIAAVVSGALLAGSSLARGMLGNDTPNAVVAADVLGIFVQLVVLVGYRRIAAAAGEMGAKLNRAAICFFAIQWLFIALTLVLDHLPDEPAWPWAVLGFVGMIALISLGYYGGGQPLLSAAFLTTMSIRYIFGKLVFGVRPELYLAAIVTACFFAVGMLIWFPLRFALLLYKERDRWGTSSSAVALTLAATTLASLGAVGWLIAELIPAGNIFAVNEAAREALTAPHERRLEMITAAGQFVFGLTTAALFIAVRKRHQAAAQATADS